MKARFHFEVDLSASVQANCDWIDKCVKTMLDKKKDIKRMERKLKKRPKNQFDLYDAIDQVEK